MENVYEHIDDYMNGLLEGEMLSQFESEMNTNASLKKAVENYASAKAISEGLLEVDMMETLKRLKDSEKGLKKGGSSDNINSGNQGTEMKTPKITRRFWLAAAFFIGLLAVTSLWIMDTNAKALDKDYILANYIRPIDEDATKSSDTNGRTNFEEGKHLFSLNRFEESIPWFESYLSEVSEKKLMSRGYFWLGAAYLESWRVEEAREAWEKSEERGVEENLKLFKTY